MIALHLTALALAAAAVHAQGTAVEIEGIEAQFTNAGIVPSLLTTFDPSALLTINYNGVGDISTGQALTIDQVSTQPTLTVTAANSTVEFSGNYTVAMVDAGVVGTDESAGVTRHWLINGATISGETVSNSSATAVADYAGPYPASGSGSHRYVILVYAEPSSFTAPQDSNPPTTVINNFNLTTYVSDAKLSLVAANYIQVSQGTSTVSVAATSSVVSSTLATPPSASGSSTGTSAGAIASSSSNGAFSMVSSPLSTIAAALSVAGFVFAF